jgi:hypothetical protein
LYDEDELSAAKKLCAGLAGLRADASPHGERWVAGIAHRAVPLRPPPSHRTLPLLWAAPTANWSWSGVSGNQGETASGNPFTSKYEMARLAIQGPPPEGVASARATTADLPRRRVRSSRPGLHRTSGGRAEVQCCKIDDPCRSSCTSRRRWARSRTETVSSANRDGILACNVKMGRPPRISSPRGICTSAPFLTKFDVGRHTL